MSEDLKTIAALTALNHMLRENHFSVCTIDRVAKMLNVQPRGEAYNILASLHCISYGNMPAELRDAIPDLIRECLNVPATFQFEALHRQPLRIVTVENDAAPKRSVWARLLTGAK